MYITATYLSPSPQHFASSLVKDCTSLSSFSLLSVTLIFPSVLPMCLSLLPPPPLPPPSILSVTCFLPSVLPTRLCLPPPPPSLPAFCQFFSHCQRLQVVSLRCCVLLDNNALTCLVQNCPMLASLCVAGCHMISDRSLIVIGQKCRYLQALDVARTKVWDSNQ